MAHVRPEFRFVLAYPQEFRKREIGERRITGELNQAIGAKFLGEFARLFFSALIAPDERRTDNFAGSVQQNCAMHLSREADARNLFSANTGPLQSFLYGGSACAPPVARLLLCPPGLRRSERLVLVRARCCDAAARVHHQSACAARANINAEEVDEKSPWIVAKLDNGFRTECGPKSSVR